MDRKKLKRIYNAARELDGELDKLIEQANKELLEVDCYAGCCDEQCAVAYSETEWEPALGDTAVFISGPLAGESCYVVAQFCDVVWVRLSDGTGSVANYLELRPIEIKQ